MGKRIAIREVRTPIRIKIYEKSAWFVFDNEAFNNKGEVVGTQIQTNFLEKHDGSWKIVYKNSIRTSDYWVKKSALGNHLQRLFFLI